MSYKKAGLLAAYIFIISGFLFVPWGNSKETDTVKVYYQPVISWAPFIIAQEEGFFEKEGFKVEFVKAQDTAQALILLLQGSLDVLVGPPTAGLYNAIDKGKDVRLVASAVSYAKGSSFAGIVFKKGQPVISDNAILVKSLKGKKVGIPIIGSLPHYFLDSLLKKNGLGDKDVELSIMPFPLILEGLRKGIIDAGFLVEPFVTLMHAGSEASFISLGDEYPLAQGSYVIYGSRLTGLDRSLGARFLVAYRNGCRQYAQGKTERNKEILNKYIDLSAEVLKEMDWPIVVPENLSQTSVLKDYQSWLVENNYISKKIDAVLMTDPEFLRKAGEAGQPR